MYKGYFVLFLRVLMGALFIFSGVAKLDNIYGFEQLIYKTGIMDWSVIPYFSRFLIATEVFLGICFFHKEGLKKFTIPATFLMLAVFCVHLGYTIVTEGGNSGNCGCFGDKFPMTPNESLIKNIVMMGVLVYLYKVKVEKPAREIFIPASLAVVSLLFVVAFFPIKSYVVKADNEVVKDNTAAVVDSSNAIATTTNNDTATSEKTTTVPIEKTTLKTDKVKEATTNPKDTKTDKVEPVVVKDDGPKLMPKAVSKFAPFKNFSNGVTTDLDAGINIVTMYNSGCDHCMENAKQVGELGKKMKLPPVRILFWGSDSEIPAFFEFAKCTQPYKLLEPQVFFPLLGKGNFPKVFLLNNGNIVGEWEGDDAVKKLEEAVKKL